MYIHRMFAVTNKNEMNEKIFRIENTIAALTYKISKYTPVNGKLPKQYYALDNKIKNLKKERQRLLSKKGWYDFLSK